MMDDFTTPEGDTVTTDEDYTVWDMASGKVSLTANTNGLHIFVDGAAWGDRGEQALTVEEGRRLHFALGLLILAAERLTGEGAQ